VVAGSGAVPGPAAAELGGVVGGPARPGGELEDGESVAVTVYKRGQGTYTRLLTVAGVMVIAAVGAYKLSQKFAGYRLTWNPYVRYGVPTLLLAGIGGLMFWLVNRPRSADFLIATEGEMKKVSWSSRKEVVGSTKVVIVTTFLLAAILFGVDLLFTFLFEWMGILGGQAAG